MKFYEFNQNNSGGKYYVCKEEKISKCILVEAFDCYHANALATEFTEIYFNGVDIGIDCECCGDRWSKVRESNVVTSLEEYIENKKNAKKISETDEDFFCILFYGKEMNIIEI